MLRFVLIVITLMQLAFSFLKMVASSTQKLRGGGGGENLTTSSLNKKSVSIRRQNYTQPKTDEQNHLYFFLLENGDFRPIRLIRKMCSANNNNSKRLIWHVRLTENRSAEFSNSFWSVTLSKTKLLKNNSTTKTVQTDLCKIIFVRILYT